MGTCYYCYWGWPEKVAEVYKKALEKLNGYDWPLKYGPAHIVWEDENFDYAEECLKKFDYNGYADFSKKELDIVKESLIELCEIPIDERDIVPDDYDGLHPENYPPPVKTIFVD